MTEVQINGNNFSDLQGFYDVVEKNLTKGLDWKIGRNLDAFNDVLRGGFGIHDYQQRIRLKWINVRKSELDFGYEATVERLNEILLNCHPSNTESVKEEIELAKSRQGPTLFQLITSIIENHEHIDFVHE